MGTAGDLVTLIAEGATGGDGHIITTYEWKFNGVVQSTSLETITHVLEAGTLDIELRVQNDCGNWSTPVTHQIIAEAFCPIPVITGIGRLR